MNKWKLTLFGALLVLATRAQDYRVSRIPDSLTRNADAVGRFEELRVVIKGIDKAVVRHKYAVTILNEKGDHFATYENSYTNLVSLGDISGRLFDADGKVLQTVRRKDISDRSASDDETLLTDERTKRYTFYHRIYPYTIEFEDEREYNGIFYLPAWLPLRSENFAAEQSRLIVETPPDYRLRYRACNFPAEPAVVTAKTKTYTWELRNGMPVKWESFFPAWEEVFPAVFIAPSEFSIAGYKGDMSTWAGLGSFVKALNAKRDELPAAVKTDVHKLVDGESEWSAKVKKLYRYMQQNTRYISIQLGIGGWQPFPASDVSTKKYGDCKALSNYMVSLLKEAGITAHYVLVKSGEGENGLDEKFPSPAYFNHAICCVPNGKDTLWLECTSQTQSAGFMGSSTGDRTALLIGENGGQVVRTPVYPSSQNNQFRRVKAAVDDRGNLVAEVFTRATGIQQEEMHGLMYQASKEQREKYLNNVFSLPTYVVEQSDYKESPGIIPSIDEYLRVKANNYATISGKRLFILPNIFNRSGTKLTDDGDRRYPISFSYAFRDIDTIQITIPEGYVPEALPRDTKLETKFGKFIMSYSIKGSTIEVIREQVRERQQFPPSAYADLVKYFDAVYKADHSRLVFVKKENG